MTPDCVTFVEDKQKVITEAEREVDWGLAASRLKHCAEELDTLIYDLKSIRGQVQIDILLSEAQDVVDEMSYIMDEIKDAEKKDGSNS